MLILLSPDDGPDPFFDVELAANFIVVGLVTLPFSFTRAAYVTYFLAYLFL